MGSAKVWNLCRSQRDSEDVRGRAQGTNVHFFQGNLVDSLAVEPQGRWPISRNRRVRSLTELNERRERGETLSICNTLIVNGELVPMTAWGCIVYLRIAEH